MKKLSCFVLLLVILQNYSITQTKIEGTYILTAPGKQEYQDEYIFSADGKFNFTRFKYLENECGLGEFTIQDSALTLTFHEIAANVRDSLRSYYVVNESKLKKGDTSEYFISVFDHSDKPLPGTTAQLVDEKGFTIVEKIRKSWEIDAKGEVTVSFPKNLNFFGIKISNKGFQTIIIPVNNDTGKTITVKMLEAEKCYLTVDKGTVKKFYIKNIRYSGFYMREESAVEYRYFKKEKE